MAQPIASKDGKSFKTLSLSANDLVLSIPVLHSVPSLEPGLYMESWIGIWFTGFISAF